MARPPPPLTQIYALSTLLKVALWVAVPENVTADARVTAESSAFYTTSDIDETDVGPLVRP